MFEIGMVRFNRTNTIGSTSFQVHVFIIALDERVSSMQPCAIALGRL